MRIVDLFCGMGGVAEAARSAASRYLRVVDAIDIDRRVGWVYQANHGVVVRHQTLESIGKIADAELWWLSPPCQPYTRRGRRLAEHDPRSLALQHLITRMERMQPEYIALENVPEFEGSIHHRLLTTVLHRVGYSVRTHLLCPTQFGVPMRRKRFYLLANRNGQPISPIHFSMPPSDDQPLPLCLEHYLSTSAWEDYSLRLSPTLQQRYAQSIDVVDANDPQAIAACFTSAYGNSPVRAGSYLHHRQTGITRRFASGEIASLMGFRSDFRWPPDMSQRVRYQLLGNSLSVTVVRALLNSLANG